ncbi:MAG: hypothetical protein RLP44_30970 [Aggregatilineales bacterium]
MKRKFMLMISVVVLSLSFTAVLAQDDDDAMVGDMFSLSAINDDPETFLGQTLTVQNDIVEALAPRIFVMEDDELLSADRLLVVYDTDSIDDFDVVQIANNDLEAVVTGTIEQFVLGDIYERFNPDLDLDLFQQTFDDYDGEVVLIASSVDIVDMVVEEDIEETDLRDILENPVALMDQEVVIQEQLVEYVSANIYRIEDKDFFNPADILVIYPGDNMVNDISVEELDDQDPEVLVTGVVRDFDLIALEDEFNVDFDNETYEGYEGPVIIASSIVLYEDVDTEDLDD